MQNTISYNERLKALALERETDTNINSSSSMDKMSSSFQNPGYSDDVILSDARLAVERVLREQGLLASNTYAITEMLKQVQPPTKPRPEMNSQIQLA